jgi:hypothetical protein
MATNQNRTIVHSKDYSSVRLDVYSTGAAYFRWIVDPASDFTRDLLRITNAKELLDSGYLEKVALLLEDEDTHRITSRGRAEVLEYSAPRSEAGFKYILDSELKPDAKIIYLMSLIALKYPLGATELEMIFSKRPDPRADWSSHITAYKLDEKLLIRYALMPGYYSPEQFKDKTLAGYKRISLTSAFIFSERSIAHRDFMEAHDEDYFIPHMALNTSFHLFQNTQAVYLKDLLPAEYIRFMEYFVQGTPSELIPWARKRFDEGVVLFREAKAKGAAKLHQGNMGPWLSVINVLTKEEANDFQNLLKEPNGFGSFTSGADRQLAPLLAYYFVEGGKSKLNELVQHILEHGPGLRDDFYRGRELQLNWHNPYSGSQAFKPNIDPYVKALEGENANYPLDWSLASL